MDTQERIEESSYNPTLLKMGGAIIFVGILFVGFFFFLQDEGKKTLDKERERKGYTKTSIATTTQSCDVDERLVVCEKVSYADIESEEFIDNETIASLDKCFNSENVNPIYDFSTKEAFTGTGFEVKYPKDEIKIELLTKDSNPYLREDGVFVYEISLRDIPDITARIEVYRLRPTIQLEIGGPVTRNIRYEQFSNTWWLPNFASNNASVADAAQCNPNTASRTTVNNYPIYTHKGGEGGYEISHYIVVMRDIPVTDEYYKGGWIEPVIVTYRTVQSYPESEDFESRRKLHEIVESIVETTELYPTSKG